MATRLLLLPYLQSWDSAALHVRLLLLPRGNPLDPLVARSPSFAEAKFALEIHLVAGLDTLPTMGGPATAVINEPVVATAKSLFNALAAKFQIDPAPPAPEPRAPGRQIKKHLPLTYQVAAQFVPRRTPLVFTDDQYSCTIRTPPPRPFNKLPPPNPKIPWGNVIAALLRQPKLGEAAGLIRQLDIAVTPVTFFADGGWLYLTLAPGSDGAGLLGMPDGLKIYAARIPALNKTARIIFTPVLFPVTAGPAAGSYDAVFAEVDDYDDGFAKIVHGAQPQQLDPLNEQPDGTRPVKELGVRLGWDDEQVTIWFNRQIDPAAATLDAQLGVFGYRIDARIVGDPKWRSLCRERTSSGLPRSVMPKSSSRSRRSRWRMRRLSVYLPWNFCPTARRSSIRWASTWGCNASSELLHSSQFQRSAKWPLTARPDKVCQRCKAVAS